MASVSRSEPPLSCGRFSNRIYLAASALGIVAVFFAIIYFISKSFIADLKNAEGMLVEMVTRDSLTGLLNRRETLRRIGRNIPEPAGFPSLSRSS